MHIETMRIRNFRRLRDVRIDLARDISIFVGANNSGKTSASHALQLFTAASRERFSIHDFSVDCWRTIDAFGEENASDLPTISLDIWFHVEAQDLHRVIDLLPNLAWQGNLVGVRVEFAAIDEPALLAEFIAARDRARANVRPGVNGGPDYHPTPRTLREYLTENGSDKLRRQFELRYFVLDRARFDGDFRVPDDYAPLRILAEKGRSGRDVLASLVRVDFLNAQRHLSDATAGGRAEDLSRCLSRFYDRNLEKSGEDFDAQRALAQSETMLNDHLERVFGPTLERLSALGYPGLTNPRLLLRTALNPATIMSSHEGAKVHYALGPDGDADAPTLPDRYNGLGFKNLIYMVVELLDLHQQWQDIVDDRPPLHLIFIEEPEAHLHAQLQQVFIRKVMDILTLDAGDAAFNTTQLVISTHSPHILYERGFRPIRYFRRGSPNESPASDVLNLSAFYDETANPTRDFLERYLKLTHCDLFFADAAVLVEGNVERLLLPQMIAMSAPRLQSTYLSILEIGGAFGHRFRSLIDFLGLTALIITDIDSVIGPVAGVAAAAEQEEGEGPDDPGEGAAGSACMVHVDGAVTSNQTLIQWLPAERSIANLIQADDAARTQVRDAAGTALVRVTYQTKVDVDWGGHIIQLAGRTLEEAFALQNLQWCQLAERADLKLRIRGGAQLAAAGIAERLHSRIKSSSFNKTDFALALLAEDPAGWQVPGYIATGLQWLEGEITPPADNAADELADLLG